MDTRFCVPTTLMTRIHQRFLFFLFNLFVLAIIIDKWTRCISSRLNWTETDCFSCELPSCRCELGPVPLHALCLWERSRYQRQADCCRPSLPALYRGLNASAWRTREPMGRADPGAAWCPLLPTSEYWLFVVALAHSFPCLASRGLDTGGRKAIRKGVCVTQSSSSELCWLGQQSWEVETAHENTNTFVFGSL